MPRSGDSIGPYTLTDKLGQGAFGVVWLAERRTSITTTRVALKTSLDDDVDLQTIKQEADLWVQASGHPNVVPIIEADVYDGRVVIVSEYAPGGTLAERLSNLQGTPMLLDTAVEMILGILAGLEHLHLRSIIHRDLKPANILLQGDTPRLTDFGISRILKTTSQSSSIAGTPVYMAPETFDGKRSAQADLWSVGVIFYELLTGTLPYPQADLSSLVGAILTRDPEPLPPSVPSAIQNVIVRALQKDPTKRYQSASEMRQALRKAMQTVQSGTPMSETRTIISNAVPPPVPPSVPLSQPIRHGVAPHYVYAGTALVIVLIIGGILVLLKSGQSARSTTDTSNLQKPEAGATSSASNSQRTEAGAPARPNSPPNSPALSEPSRTSPSFQSIESKILNGTLLSEGDIAGFSQPELKLLRNTVYARHGRPFQRPELQRYFDGRPWYTSRNSYSNAELTADDQANIKLIQRAANE
jgi:serine/threonine protein kinase